MIYERHASWGPSAKYKRWGTREELLVSLSCLSPSPPDINNCPKENDVYGKKKKKGQKRKRNGVERVKREGERGIRKARESPSHASHKLLPQMCDFS